MSQESHNIGDSQRVETDEIKQILNERGSRYGKFENIATISCELETVFYEGLMANLNKYEPEYKDNVEALLEDKFPPFMREGVKMIVHKLARIANGDPFYDDSWKDIAGYATLVVEILNKENK